MHTTTHRTRTYISIAAGISLLAGMAGCGSDDPAADPGNTSPVTVATPTTTTVDATPSTEVPDGSSPVSESTAPSTVAETPTPDTVAAPTSTLPATTAPPPEPSGPIADAVAVAATPNGVVVDGGDNTWDTVIIDDTTLGIPRLIDGLVVYQGTDGERPGIATGPILVSDGGETRKFTDGDNDLVLHDVGHVDGATVMLASSRVAMPPNPEAANGRLLLVDTATFEVTELGEPGEFEGWEVGVSSARFGDDAISLTVSVNTSRTLEVIEFDGTSRHSIELPGEKRWNLIDFDESVWAVDAGFRGPEVDNFLDIRQVDLTDGSVREATIFVDLSGLGERAADGYCGHADFLEGEMLCDQTIGAPFTFPIEGDAVAAPVVGLSDGTAMFRASQ